MDFCNMLLQGIQATYMYNFKQGQILICLGCLGAVGVCTPLKFSSTPTQEKFKNGICTYVVITVDLIWNKKSVKRLSMIL